MTTVKVRIKVDADGTLSGRAVGLAAGEHEAVITVPTKSRRSKQLNIDEVLEEVRRIQAEVARLPVLDDRSADEIIGYNEHGDFC